MVEVSKLRSLDIYTNTGHYVGRVEDVILNIRLGTISKLQVRAIEQQPKPAGISRSFIDMIRGEAPEETNMRSFQNDLLTVDFDKVQAIGDIMLINPRDMKKVNPEPQIPEVTAPKPENPEPPVETQSQFEPERL
ncbi:PRC-barrel domain-containing protein [Methanobrevibacter sp.]